MTSLWIFIGVVAAYLLLKKFTGAKVEHWSMAELEEKLKEKNAKRQYIDVRTPQEFSERKIKGFKNIPLGALSKRMSELDKDIPVVLICASGSRSMQGASVLSKAGYTQLINVRGGIAFYKG